MSNDEETDEIVSQYLLEEYAYSPITIPTDASTSTDSQSTLPLTHSFDSLFSLIEDELSKTNEAETKIALVLRELQAQAQRLSACLAEMSHGLRQLNQAVINQGNTLKTTASNLPVASHKRSSSTLFQVPNPKRLKSSVKPAPQTTSPPQ